MAEIQTYDVFSRDNLPIGQRPRPQHIEGEVETAEQAEARRQQAIKKKRRELADTVKDTQRRLDESATDYRLAKIAAGGTSLVAAGIIFGWILTIGWGLAINFHGGSGGAVTFCLIGLVVLTIADGIGLACALDQTYKKHHDVRAATHRRADAVEASADYELELHSQS